MSVSDVVPALGRGDVAQGRRPSAVDAAGERGLPPVAAEGTPQAAVAGLVASRLALRDARLSARVTLPLADVAALAAVAVVSRRLGWAVAAYAVMVLAVLAA
ncbi:MAG: hypothetical protein WAK82_31795, partial [Streptosporangiaceae bacterium]